MDQPTKPSGFAPSWLLILGLLLGASLLALMALDSSAYLLRKERHMAAANVIELTSENWQKEVAESTVPVLVDFWAPWCGPCRALAPTIDKLAAKYDGKVKVGKLNVDDAGDIAAQYGITSIPRVLVFKGGDKPRRSIVGLVSEGELAKAIDGVIAEQ
jgi:thioredoxin 1